MQLRQRVEQGSEPGSTASGTVHNPGTTVGDVDVACGVHSDPCGPGGRLVEAYDFPFTDVDGSPMILEVDVDITEPGGAPTC
jgi:hypothetical protein